MKKRWPAILSEINKKLLLILLIIVSAGMVNVFVSGQRLVLTFYNLPTLFAAYYFGRRRAVMAAIASILFVVWVNTMNPAILGGSSGTRSPYRKGLSLFEARDIILKGSGTDFDPVLVRAFESAFRKQQLEVPEVLV
jgi:hypothetical protein